MHGFGLNVGSDLSGYEAITPCGIAGVTMTSLSRELGREISVEETATKAGSVFTARYPLLSALNPQPSTQQP
jgi:lipoate-protein ligase B